MFGEELLKILKFYKFSISIFLYVCYNKKVICMTMLDVCCQASGQVDTMLEFRLFEPEDRETYLVFSKDFYSGGAALGGIPQEFAERTFDRVLEGSPFADGFMLLSDGERAGYCLISFLWSTEAGGLLALIDELYVSPTFRGKQLGGSFLQQLEQYYAGRIVGFRLEVCGTNLGAIRLYQRQGFDFLEYRQMRKLFKQNDR